MGPKTYNCGATALIEGSRVVSNPDPREDPKRRSLKFPLSTLSSIGPQIRGSTFSCTAYYEHGHSYEDQGTRRTSETNFPYLGVKDS